MKIRSLALALVAAAATSAAFANASSPKPVVLRPVPQEQTVAQDLVAGMREILRAVTPAIALPSIEITLPTLVRR